MVTNAVPGISFSQKSGRVTIFRSTLAAIGYPEFYRFLYNPDAHMLAIEPCEMDAPGSYALVMSGNKSDDYRVVSVDFVRMIFRDSDWDGRKRYRVSGTAYPGDRIVEFNLKEAEIWKGKITG
jgi:hypothetical protein